MKIFRKVMDRPLGEVRENLLENISNIYRNSEAMGYFLAILSDQLEPYYKNIDLEPPGALEILISPVFGDLKGIQRDIDKKGCKKTLLRAYNDRKIEIYEDNADLKRVSDRLIRLTDGNFRIYSKGELKYLY